MKIAFVGKGGSGKTTLASLFAKRAAELGRPVLAVDADVNQHLAAALGIEPSRAAALPSLGENVDAVKEHLRGDNPRIGSAAEMIKTTPAGRGSRLLDLSVDDRIWRDFTAAFGTLRFAAAGGFAEDDLGTKCYHSKVGAVELILNHLTDGPGEYVVVDMVAGAEAFASGMFTRFDHTFLVCEPTVRSLGVYRQYLQYSSDWEVPLSVIGNKVDDEEDEAFLRRHAGGALLGCFGRSRHVKAAERGEPGPLSQLEPENLALLDAAREKVDAGGQDWERFTRQGWEFHRRNAAAWAGGRVGVDLEQQIDSEFRLGAHRKADSLDDAKV